MREDRYQALLHEAYRKIRALSERSPNEPLAVIGVGCRFPGGGTDASSFWESLCQGVDGIVELPAGRWDTKQFFESLGHTDGSPKIYGGFLDEVDRFDPEFFGISRREAVYMDPQQRLFLEVCWEALENAGIPPPALAGTACSVFTGVHSQSSDYFWMQVSRPELVSPHTATGTALNVIPGRVSYLLDLRGPGVAVDTACSSSLMAVHLACQSLRSGESDLALAGGVNLRVAPYFTIATSRMGSWPADYRVKAFDDAADGVISGEGCGVIVLKLLSAALRDGDRVDAVIRGSASNQDGASLGLTAPNGESQKQVIRSALRSAGVEGSEIGYIEAHGTGTELGDPIELQALLETVGAGEIPCAIGAVKSNFGHLEGAAGIAGLIKTVLALRSEAIPPNLHFHKLNRHVSLEGSRLFLPTALSPWPRGDRPRRAGVSSFGWSGTNVHIVLEEGPLRTPSAISPAPISRPSWILPLSARTPGTLAETVRAHIEFLAHTTDALSDICYTAAIRRQHHECRFAVAGDSVDDLLRGLRDYPRTGSHNQLVEQYIAGDPVEWAAIYPHGGACAALPTYCWQRQRLWFGAESNEVLFHRLQWKEAAPPPEECLILHASGRPEEWRELLALIQSEAPRAARRLWVITPDPAVCPDAALLWGLMQTLACEHAALYGGICMQRDGKFYAREIVRADAPAPRPGFRIDPNGSYLITGGSGYIAKRIARRLGGQGAGRVVLASRHPDRNGLSIPGCEVRTVPVDVSDPIAVEALMAELQDSPYPLRGVIHAAGILDDGVLLNLTPARFERVLAVKAGGARNLDRATRAIDLDFFVMFSSAAGILGSPGQSSYAAANAYVDALVLHRRAQGLPGLSINWGPWEGSDMVKQSRRNAVPGLRLLGDEEAVSAFGQALASDTDQIVILPIDPAQFRNFGGEKREAKGATVREIVAEVLDTSVDRIAPDVPLLHLGLDSLLALELRQRIESASGVVIPLRGLLEGANVEDVARMVGNAHAQRSRAAGTGMDPLPAALEHISSLSDEEVERLLALEDSEA